MHRIRMGVVSLGYTEAKTRRMKNGNKGLNNFFRTCNERSGLMVTIRGIQQCYREVYSNWRFRQVQNLFWLEGAPLIPQDRSNTL